MPETPSFITKIIARGVRRFAAKPVVEEATEQLKAGETPEEFKRLGEYLEQETAAAKQDRQEGVQMWRRLVNEESNSADLPDYTGGQGITVH